ncbi:MAG TPA: methyltransferase domain-containing protein [Verrucomicrobiae bacterium]|nr:methyltransferase domain-containing protein [Verrucomicrobiae bacterium]
MAEPRKPVSAPAFWEGLYAEHQDGWELGEAAPSLGAWLAAGRTFTHAGASPRAAAMSRSPHIAVPGCGRGHDARLLARHGYAVTGFDFADAAIAEARGLAARERLAVAFEQRDIFTLGADYAGRFDAVWEYTCFCAIDPDRRAEYAQVLQAILRPGGILLACFYPLREGTDGPPFPVSREGIETVLEPCFRIVEARAPPASPERRRNFEWFVTAERRAP